MRRINARKVLHSWETVRYELLNTRVSDLEIRIEGSPIEPLVQRLYRELEAKHLLFQPEVYLTDSWGCTDEVPIIGIPFYLCDERLSRLEEEQTGYLETRQEIMMLLRHEAGHAVNYAYRLFNKSEWVDTFGQFSKPYREHFRPNPHSRHFVRHIDHHKHGRTYAQKHPDEDFAETFAVWLTPRSGWRQKYQNWPALRKLNFMNDLMKSLRAKQPRIRRGEVCLPVHEMTYELAEHYGRRARYYRAEAQGYVDDKLREVFPPVKSRALARAPELLHKHRHELRKRVARWSGLDANEMLLLIAKLEDRAEALDLSYRRIDTAAKIMDITALATAMALDIAHTGRLTG